MAVFPEVNLLHTGTVKMTIPSQLPEEAGFFIGGSTILLCGGLQIAHILWNRLTESKFDDSMTVLWQVSHIIRSGFGPRVKLSLASPSTRESQLTALLTSSTASPGDLGGKGGKRQEKMKHDYLPSTSVVFTMILLKMIRPTGIIVLHYQLTWS